MRLFNNDERTIFVKIFYHKFQLSLIFINFNSPLYSALPGIAEDARLCVSLAGCEPTIVLERGSITGIKVRGLEPKEALLDTPAVLGL